MSTDFRALCAELTATLAERINDKGDAGSYYVHAAHLLIRARAALAQLTPQTPADGKVVELPPRPPLMGPPAHPALERYGITWDGSPDKPLLTRRADGYWTPWHVAADLLERQQTVPVAVSERLPAMVTDGLRVAGDCDEQGRCWAGTRASVDTSGDRDIDLPPSWELREVCAQDDVWLPAHALPLPEVNNG